MAFRPRFFGVGAGAGSSSSLPPSAYVTSLLVRLELRRILPDSTSTCWSANQFLALPPPPPPTNRRMNAYNGCLLVVKENKQTKFKNSETNLKIKEKIHYST